MRLPGIDSTVLRPHRDLFLTLMMSASANTLAASFTIFYVLIHFHIPTWTAAAYSTFLLGSAFLTSLLLGKTPLGRLGAKKGMLVGLAALGGFYVCMVALDAAFLPAAVLSAILFGVYIFAFFTPFNAAALTLTSQGNRGTVLSAYGLVFPVVAASMPLIGGILTDTLSYGAVALVALAIVAADCVFVWRIAEVHEIKPFVLRRELFGCVPPRASAGMFFQGMFDGAIWASMAIILLDYVKTPTQYGGFVSAFAIFGAVAALILARISDRVRGRRTFLIAGLAILIPAAAIGTTFHDVVGFSLAMILINFSLPIAGVFLFAIAADAASTRPHDVAFLREILLNAGRVSAAAIVLVLVLSGLPANLSFAIMLAAAIGMSIAK